MATTKFTPPPVPNDASPEVRQYLDEQMRRLSVLVNDAAQVEEDETISGDWTFTGSVTLPEAAVTDHEAALTILESQITDGSLLARLAANETITGAWTFSASTNTFTGTLAGSVIQATNEFQAGDGASNDPSYTFVNDGDTGMYLDSVDRIGFTVGGVLNTDIRSVGLVMRLGGGTSMYMGGKAAANTDFSGYGQLWVKNTTPTQLWFTDDAGTDTQIV